MPDLPSGTVAFLFTDIEGSTTLWERDAVAMRTAVARHHALLMDVIVAHRGGLYQHVRYAVQVTFPTAVDALPAAVVAQCALTAAAGVQTRPVLTELA